MSVGPAERPSRGPANIPEGSGLLRWPDAKLIAFLILCAFLPYANTLLNGFVYDDHRQVTHNPYLRSFHHLPEIFTTTVWSYVGAQGLTNYYRPTMILGYLLCYQLFGPLAYGFHLANILLHTAVVYILFRVTEQMFGNRSVAFAASLIFALHPIHTESVAWIAAVTDLELTVFYLLTFWFFLRVACPGGMRSDKAQFGMTASFVLTILSKEQAVTLPVIATIYEHFYREDRNETTWGQKLPRYAVLWLLAITYLLFRVRVLGGFATKEQMPELTWYQGFLSAFALVGQYLWKLLWPVHLCAFYVFRRSESVSDPRVLAGLGALLLCIVLFVVFWKQVRTTSFAILWLLVTLAPVLNVRWMAANVFTERYLYLPSVGFCWLLAWSWYRVWLAVSKHTLLRRRALVGAVCLVCLLCVARIVTRNRDWRNDWVLYTRTLAASPEAYHIRINLGVVYWGIGNPEAAEQMWREALKVSPKNAIILTNLGLAALRQKRYAEAVDLFQRAIRVKPHYTDPHLGLGMAYAEMGSKDLAELQFRAAVALSPLNQDARNRLGRLYFDAGRLWEAEQQFRRSIESEPNLEGYNRLGDIYLCLGKRVLAEDAYKRALLLDPFDSHPHFKLGEIYATSGRSKEALKEYQAGLQTDPANPKALEAIKKLRP